MTAQPDPRTAELAANLQATRRRIRTAAEAAGRDRADIALLVVTKFHPAEDLVRLVGLGEREFGESREPEAGRKIAAVRAALSSGEGAVDDGDVAFAADMIGSVQRKKAGSIARWARRVHSVDSLALIDSFDGAAQRALDAGERASTLGVLLQVSLDGDPERGGLVSDDLAEAADRVLAASNSLALEGLMLIAPLEMAAAEAMSRIAEIRQDFVERYPGATELSAGMSGDVEEAIAHGSTCVRVGTAILGARPILSP
ncbi:YggS family pyridoxal phosphate-dependent enzyme [Gordonia hydrophobica]|uniref:Pyridoxal phosphate homeostasis protein n=1 Tax=Gordonia hydrophobica TaxID=40516 RepID=A0ABZ2U1J5_9ACTN|nr:YggS family pyridoxal phosphate-dependent enzyme [Gordonia hydrophobica]MBM7367119.1 pyridoxal phosphate enzyme (YggS family) [Gordonia hydrophobica]